MTRLVLLDDVPSLAHSYARALGAAARAGARSMAHRGSGTDPGAVPDVVYEARSVRADRDRLASYQHLVGEPGTDELPAGFVHVLAFPVAMALMARADFPLPLLGLVHLANRVEQAAALSLADAVDVRAWAGPPAAHPRGVQVDLVTEVVHSGTDRSHGAAVVWRGVSTYLARSARAPSSGTGGARTVPPRQRFIPPEPTGRWDLPGDVGRAYAAVSGDRNPIHLTALGARAFGFRRAVAHGMYTAALGLAAIGAARGEAFAWDVTFDAPVLIPGRAAVRIEHTTGTWRYVAWDPRTRRRHLEGVVTAH